MISYDRVTDAGTIDIKKQQALIVLEDVYSGNLMTIAFDIYPKEILQNDFFVKITAKVYGNNGDIFSVGLCSKKELDKSVAKEILGNRDNRVLVVS